MVFQIWSLVLEPPVGHMLLSGMEVLLHIIPFLQRPASLLTHLLFLVVFLLLQATLQGMALGKLLPVLESVVGLR